MQLPHIGNGMQTGTLEELCEEQASREEE